MQVKKIHFIDTVPGLPVYEMEDGEIRIPFPNGTKTVWITEKEALFTIVKKTPANEKAITEMFKFTREQIEINTKILKKV